MNFLQLIYRSLIKLIPLRYRFYVIVILSYLIKPIFWIRYLFDTRKLNKYRLEQGLSLSLIWLLYPLKKVRIQPKICYDKDIYNQAFREHKTGLLAVGFHGLFQRFFQMHLIDDGLNPISIGSHKEENMFGCSFPNAIQPHYMFLKKVATFLNSRRIVSAFIDTEHNGKQTRIVKSRYGEVRIAIPLLKVAIDQNAALLFFSPQIKGFKVYFNLKFIASAEGLEQVLDEFESFLIL